MSRLREDYKISDKMKCEIEEFTPRRSTRGSSGYDFYSPVDADIVPGEWTEIDTLVRFDGTEKLYLSIGDRANEEPGFGFYVMRNVVNWCMKFYPRSGLSTRTGFRVRTTVGIIDQDYRDTIKLKATADVPVHIDRGDRIAQGVFVPFLILDDEIEPTEERKGGFGSTGV